jgi:maspardin
MGEIKGQSLDKRTVTVNEPYLLDANEVVDRLARFQAIYRERASSVGGQQWRYRRTGLSAHPLVMLPGIQGDGSVFFDVALALGDSVDLVTVTAPPIVDAVAMADAQAAFLVALGVQHIDLFGASLGGYLAQVFGIRHPDRLRKIFLANTFADPAAFLAKAPSADSIAGQPAEQVMAQNLAPMLAAPATDAGQVALQSVMRALVGPVQTADEYKARLITLLESWRSTDSRSPTIGSSSSTTTRIPNILPEMCSFIRGRYRSARHYMIAGGGHLPAIQRPRSVASILLDQLRGG